MTKTSPKRISAIALLLPLFLGMIAFASMRPGTGGLSTSTFAAQNTNKNGATMSGKKPSTKTDCSKADDAALASQISKRLYKNSSLKYEKEITVDVKAGVATLSGKVQLNRHRVVAAAEAKKVKCIKSVVDSISFGCDNCKQFCCDDVCVTHRCPGKTNKPK